MSIIIFSDFQVRLKVLPHVPVHRALNDLQFGWFPATPSSLRAQVSRWKSQLLHPITVVPCWIRAGFSLKFISPTGPTRPVLIHPVPRAVFSALYTDTYTYVFTYIFYIILHIE